MIRQIREQRAFERVRQDQSAFEHADRRAAEAQHVLTEHVERLASQQTALLGDMIGQTLRSTDLQQVQNRYESAVDETAKLSHKAGEAHGAAEERRLELRQTRAVHLSMLRKVEKVTGLLKQMESKTLSGQVALAEQSDDEDRAALKPRSPS